LLQGAAPSGLIPLPGGGEKSREVTAKAPGPHEFVVHASNVPIGYDESVIGRDPHTGRKHLYGFRYRTRLAARPSGRTAPARPSS